MASFSKNNVARKPFGVNEYLRSTDDVKTDSFTMASNGIPFIDVDGDQQKILQPGTIIAKITSGPNAGKCGVFQAAGTDEVQTITKAGTWTSGTYTLTIGAYTTDPIAFGAVAATIQAAINAKVPAAWGVTVTGGPLSTTPVVVTFNGDYGINQPLITADTTNIVGAGTAASVETTPGAVGATDGRQTPANIVGINDTVLPWQLLERDVEIAVVYEATVVQAWCIEYNAAGSPIPLSNTTRDAILALPGMRFIFK
jgi:hypothetical protein